MLLLYIYIYIVHLFLKWKTIFWKTNNCVLQCSVGLPYCDWIKKTSKTNCFVQSVVLRNAAFHVQEVVAVFCRYALVAFRRGDAGTWQLTAFHHVRENGFRRGRVQNWRGSAGADPTSHRNWPQTQPQTVVCHQSAGRDFKHRTPAGAETHGNHCDCSG